MTRPGFDCPEWEILCSCARTQPDAMAVERLHSLLNGEVDWELLYQLARRNGVVVLLHRTLTQHAMSQVPPGWMAKIREESLAHGKRNLLTAQELVRLTAVFEGNGIPALALKGPALAASAYSDLSLRQYGDLDILVFPQDVERVTNLLLQDSYFTDGTVLESERPFGRRDGWVMVDLHWGVTVPHFSNLLDEVGMWERARTIPLAGGAVRTLAAEDHLLALAVHGFKDGWHRLKWVGDVAELVARHPALEWDVLMQRAKDRGALRIVWVACALAEKLLDLELPNPVGKFVKADVVAKKLAQELAIHLPRVDRPGVRPRVLEVGLTEFRLQFRTLTDPSQRRAYVGHRLRLLLAPTAEDRSKLPLPAALSSLHYITRPFRLAWSYGVPWLRA